MPVLACIAATTSAQRRRLAELCGPAWRVEDCRHDPDRLQALGPEVRIVYGRVPAACLDQLPHLAWVQVPWAGVGDQCTPALRARAVVLTNVRGAYATVMAEHVVAGLLYFSRDLGTHAAATRAHRWREGRDLRCATLAGSGVCVLGAGAIGRVLCPRLHALGMEVVAISRRGHAVDGADAVGTPADLPEFLPRCRHLVVTLPGTVHTRHMVDAEVLRALQPGGVLVNVGRGTVVDEAAVLAALDRGHLSGALLDVTDPEPPPAESPLFDHPRLILTAHRSCHGSEGDVDRFAVLETNLRAFLAGDRSAMINVVDQGLGY